MKMRVILDDGAPLPIHAKQDDAGLDLTSRIEIELWPGSDAMVPTGVIAEIPQGYVGLVFPRSGLSSKHGITLKNSVGVIDSGYRGVIHAPLYNIGEKPYIIKRGERICQLVVVPCARVECVAVDELSETKRGDSGFGSSGKFVENLDALEKARQIWESEPLPDNIDDYVAFAANGNKPFSRKKEGTQIEIPEEAYMDV